MGRAALQVSRHGHAGESAGIALALRPAHKTVKDIEVDAFEIDARGDGAADARQRQHLEFFLLQGRDEAGIDQRSLSRSGLRIEKDRAVGHSQAEQVADLGLATEKEPLILTGKGARADVRLEADLLRIRVLQQAAVEADQPIAQRLRCEQLTRLVAQRDPCESAFVVERAALEQLVELVHQRLLHGLRRGVGIIVVV